MLIAEELDIELRFICKRAICRFSSSIAFNEPSSTWAGKQCGSPLATSSYSLSAVRTSPTFITSAITAP